MSSVSRRTATRVLVLAATLALLPSCNTRARPAGPEDSGPVSAGSGSTSPAVTTQTARPGGTETSPPAIAAGTRWNGPGVSWIVPEGWQQKTDAGSAMRVATLAKGELELSVIPLGMKSTLVDNVQRWRGQLGLTPATPEELATLTRKVEIPGAEAHVVDMTGSGQRMLVLMATLPDKVWFFKIQGSADLVSPEKEAFEQFVASVRFQ